MSEEQGSSTIALGERALELVKELKRNPNTIPMYNTDGVRKVFEDVNVLVDANSKDAQATMAGAEGLYPSIQVRHASIERNKRCLIAYHHERVARLRRQRWTNGSVLTTAARAPLGTAEIDWFHGYNTCLSRFMMSLGDGEGCDITVDQRPPCPTVHISVVCLKDYGELLTSDGSVVNLCANATYSLRQVDCENLIRQGVLKQTSSF